MAEDIHKFTDMLHESEEGGYWWIPGSDERIAGTLSYTPLEGLHLRLMGSLFPHAESLTHDRVPTVQGYLLTGKAVTLVGCLRSEALLSIPGYFTEAYCPKCAFVGWHFAGEAEAKFERIDYLVHNAECCMGVSGFDNKALLTAVSDRAKGLPLHYTYPPKRKCKVGSFGITASWNCLVSGLSDTWRTLREQLWFQAEAEKGMPYLDFLKGPLSSIHMLLTLAADEWLPIKKVVGYSSKCRRDESDPGTSRVPVHLLWGQALHLPPPAPKSHFELAFTLASLGNRLGAVLRQLHRFKAEYDATSSTLNLLLRHEKQLPWNHQFTSLVYGLESYHRRRFPKGDLTPGRHARRLKAILNAAPSKDRDWLESRLQYANEVPLRRRMRELCDLLPAQIQEMLGDTKAFVNAVVTTRNYMTHFDRSLRAKALSGGALLQCITRLGLVLRTLILREMRFTDQEIATMAKRLKYAQRINILTGQP